MNVLVFDIETIPDVEAGGRLYGLEGVGEGDVAKAMEMRQRQRTGGSDFLPLFLHRVVAISVVRKSGENFLTRSLGEEDSSEAELLRSFFEAVEQRSPILVSWNGSGFDLPVLHYRALFNGVTARRYWDVGDDERDFRYNNYVNRYHWRHIDLMDVLAGFNPRAFAPLNEVATLLGLPGKQGIGGDKVWEAFQEGRVREIREYCEVDALNTFLVYLHWEVMRGNLDKGGLEREVAGVKEWLRGTGKAHFGEFVGAWEGRGG